MDIFVIMVLAFLFMAGSLWLSRGLDRITLRQQRFGEKPPPPPLTSQASAQRLVRGIAELHPICVFLATAIDQASENDQIILDSLAALGVTPKIVDTSKDSDMPLGLPQIDGQPDLPQLYIDGTAFGGVKTVLDAIPSGSLAAALTSAGIPFDTIIAVQLTQP